MTVYQGRTAAKIERPKPARSLPAHLSVDFDDRRFEFQGTPAQPGRRGIEPAQTAYVQRLQTTLGNRQVQRMFAPGARAIQRITDEALAARADAAAAPTATAEREIGFMTMKRKNIHLTGEDKYGHWWTELGGESYGWWPKYPLGGGLGGLWDTLTGVEGELNGQTSFGGTPTRDPHHGDSGETEFHPRLRGTKTDAQVRDDVRAFARAYHGEWRWTLGWGQNCHTFQKALMAHVGLVEP